MKARQDTIAETLRAEAENRSFERTCPTVEPFSSCKGRIRSGPDRVRSRGCPDRPRRGCEYESSGNNDRCGACKHWRSYYKCRLVFWAATGRARLPPGFTELYLSHRVLIHAVEGYLLGCVEYPVLTAEAALRRTTGTDSPIDLLQAEEDSMIQKFGPPWMDHSVTFGESSLYGLQATGMGIVPERGAATSGTTAPWCWPWR
jgi:hypothetical protein